MDAFDSSALMTETGAFLAAQMCSTGYADHNAKKPFAQTIAILQSCEEEISVPYNSCVFILY